MAQTIPVSGVNCCAAYFVTHTSCPGGLKETLRIEAYLLRQVGSGHSFTYHSRAEEPSTGRDTVTTFNVELFHHQQDEEVKQSRVKM